ncbi:MAG: MotA/TolQ/ExbB proton channel family protein [Gammaproteobacteria bacterium]|nr:MotA/TolQ/ExbB proton channel family protein [Gammaproteobacteria bacterium]
MIARPWRAAAFALACLAGNVCGAPAAPADLQSLDALLKDVLEANDRESAADAAREQRFLAERDQQQARVDEARALLAAEQARGERLRSTFSTQQDALEKSRAAIREAAGGAAELRATVKRIGGDVGSLLRASLVTAQFPDRATKAETIAAQDGVPTIDDLQELWHLLLQEAVESGKTVRFAHDVAGPGGKAERREVLRVGAFTALGQGRFLRYLPETGRLVEPARQPESPLRGLAGDLESAPGGIVPAPIDPTRGALLAVLAQRPGVIDRVRQAGVVGYFILALGLVALGAIGERAWRLHRVLRDVTQQRQADIPNGANPLGRLLLVARGNAAVDAETLALKLDEAILAELPALRRRLSMLGVLATAAPLVGLLGTVAGMIETFQSMTLFGSGDPKVVSGGISLALVATELGLVVAIPILLSHAWLHGVSNRVVHLLEQEAAALVAHREEHKRVAAGVR